MLHMNALAFCCKNSDEQNQPETNQDGEIDMENMMNFEDEIEV